jgi:hypothetical protein
MESLPVPEKYVFPMPCPHCKASSVYPYEAATVRGHAATIRVELRCRQCKHEWRLDLDNDPSPDRES